MAKTCPGFTYEAVKDDPVRRANLQGKRKPRKAGVWVPRARLAYNEHRDDLGRFSEGDSGGGAAKDAGKGAPSDRIMAVTNGAHVDLGNMRPEVQNIVADRFEAAAKDYPESMGNLIGVRCGEMYGRTDNAYASVGGIAGNVVITFSGEHFGSGSNPAGLEAQLRQDEASGYVAKGTGSVAGIVDHEIGHVIDKASNNELSRTGTFRSLTTIESRGSISRYAETDSKEGFAEAFAAHQAGTLSGPVAADMDSALARAASPSKRLSVEEAARTKPTCPGYGPQSRS